MIEERDPIDPAQPEAEIKDKKQTKTAKNHKPHIYIYIYKGQVHINRDAYIQL